MVRGFIGNFLRASFDGPLMEFVVLSGIMEDAERGVWYVPPFPAIEFFVASGINIFRVACVIPSFSFIRLLGIELFITI
jgi:hypothetical protein